MDLQPTPSDSQPTYCPSCLARADPAAPGPGRPQPSRYRLTPSTCVWCHGCGFRLHTAEFCPLCPCPERQWLVTDTAARFAAAIRPYLDLFTDLDQVWTTGDDLCLVGIPPEDAAAVAIEVYG